MESVWRDQSSEITAVILCLADIFSDLTDVFFPLEPRSDEARAVKFVLCTRKRSQCFAVIGKVCQGTVWETDLVDSWRNPEHLASPRSFHRNSLEGQPNRCSRRSSLFMHWLSVWLRHRFWKTLWVFCQEVIACSLSSRYTVWIRFCVVVFNFTQLVAWFGCNSILYMQLVDACADWRALYPGLSVLKQRRIQKMWKWPIPF